MSRHSKIDGRNLQVGERWETSGVKTFREGGCPSPDMTAVTVDKLNGPWSYLDEFLLMLLLLLQLPLFA